RFSESVRARCGHAYGLACGQACSRRGWGDAILSWPSPGALPSAGGTKQSVGTRHGTPRRLAPRPQGRSRSGSGGVATMIRQPRYARLLAAALCGHPFRDPIWRNEVFSPSPEKPVKRRSRHVETTRRGFPCSGSNLGRPAANCAFPRTPLTILRPAARADGALADGALEEVMRGVRYVIVSLLLCGLIPTVVQAEELSRLELNAAETANNRCLLTFVIENKTSKAIESLKLDLALFNTEGIIQRRMITEMGPIRGART